MNKLYTVKEVASILGVEYHTALSLINQGFIPSIRINRSHRISENNLNTFISAADGGESVIYELK